jgi:hypothetical protein
MTVEQLIKMLKPYSPQLPVGIISHFGDLKDLEYARIVDDPDTKQTILLLT